MSNRNAPQARSPEIAPDARGGRFGAQADGTQRWPAGAEPQKADLQGLWLLRQGVLALGHTVDKPRPHYLALPGDWIGVETLIGEPAPAMSWVLADAVIVPAACSGPSERSALLAAAYAQARRQALEFLQLRSGSLADRVRHLLLLLGVSQGEDMDVELPSLRQLAGLLDATPEAICRVLSGLRRMDVLVPKPLNHTLVARRALHELVAPPGLSSGLGRRRLGTAAS
jgi:hypothetical protein